MKLRTYVYSLTGLSCLMSLKVIMPGKAFADEVGKGCDRNAKSPALTYPANQHLSSRGLKTKAFFTKNLPKDSVPVSFEIFPYKTFIQKYPDMGVACEIALKRIVAVIVVDHPKGINTGFAVYSKALAISLFDAQTGMKIGSSVTGDMIRGGRPF
jgi:hypothetical protein